MDSKSRLIVDAEELSEYSKPELLQKIKEKILTAVTMIKLPNRNSEKLFLIYLLELEPVPQVIVTLETLFATDHQALSRLSSLSLENLLINVDKRFFPVLKQHGGLLTTDLQIFKKVAIRLMLMANVSRILFLNTEGLLTSETLLQVMRVPGLVLNVLNCLYQRIGESCRKFHLNKDQVVLGEISQLEKKYIMVFRFIKSNGIELCEICNVSECLQAVMNTYLYNLIKYFLEHTNENERVNVSFCHYSNFPISNKIVLSPIYNNTNYVRIQELLRDQLFIKRIVKKNIGKRIIWFKNLETSKIPSVLIETEV